MRDLTLDEMQYITGAGDVDTASSKEHGNNGWGNGADPTNPGSFSGATAPSKSCNCSDPAAGDINTNPTDSDGR